MDHSNTKKRRNMEQGGVDHKLPRSSPLAFGWQKLYKETHVVEMSHTQSNYPVKVTFQPTCSNWKLIDCVDQFCTEVIFKKTVLENCAGFDASIEWAPANELQTLLTEAGYKCESSMGPYKRGSVITTKASTPAMEQLYGLLENAMVENTSNGPTKLFFRELLNWMLKDLSAAEKFCVENPVTSSLCVSKYIKVDEYLPGSPETPVSSLEKEDPEGHFIVPDAVVYGIYDNYFALNVEIKQPVDNVAAALVQCFTQMLSHMHTQNLHFGLFFSGREWILIVAIKMNDRISVRQFQKLMYCMDVPRNEDTLPVNLDVDSFISMIQWIYRILSWNMKHV